MIEQPHIADLLGFDNRDLRWELLHTRLADGHLDGGGIRRLKGNKQNVAIGLGG